MPYSKLQFFSIQAPVFAELVSDSDLFLMFFRCSYVRVHPEKRPFLFIRLPSGRCLAYVKPRICENQFGGEGISYYGMTPQKKYERLESYGPKLVENITQAISRDILAHAMKTLRNERIVGHVHDEIILEAEKDASVLDICEQMGRTPAWIPGLVLRADGYDCEYYRKD